jgi:FecR-like protein
MASNATFGQVRLLGLALAGLAAIVLSPGATAAPVGVTSGADGKPLGKPPNENERVLRIGIDVQANERVTTAANDRAHLVFLDGSSLTVGPNAELVIDKFVYDPNTQQGELAVNASKGVFRLVGGKISKKNEITIKTPSSTIGIRGAIAVFTVTNNQTIANFAYGQYMKVSGLVGGPQISTRFGSTITTNNGQQAGPPIVGGKGSLNSALGQLEGSSSTGNNSADQKSQQSGFSSQNSGQPFLNNLPNFNQNNPPNPNNNTLTNALSNSNPAGQPVGNSTPTNQTTTKIVTATNSNAVTNTNTSTNSNTNTSTTTSVSTTTNPNPTPTPTPSGQTLNGFGSGLVIVTRGHMGGENSHDHRHSLRPTNLSLGTTVSITTDPANNQAQGTIRIPHLNGSTATLQLGGVNSTFTDNQTYAMITANDPTRRSSFQTGDHTVRLRDQTVLATNAVASSVIDVPVRGTPGACTCEFLSWGWWATTFRDPQHHDKRARFSPRQAIRRPIRQATSGSTAHATGLRASSWANVSADWR